MRSSSLRSKLRAVFERSGLPTSPGGAVQILSLIEDPSSSATDFAEIIRLDPALTAKLLKMANSVSFAQRNGVTTIQRAVTVIGLRRLRIAALGFDLIRHLDQLGGHRFDMRRFWQESVLRACLARAVAKEVVPACAEEAFLIGLLQDCGIPLLVHVFGNDYAALYERLGLSSESFLKTEREHFGCDHVDAIAVTASEWKLPDLVSIPLGQHHTRTLLTEKSPELARLSAVSYLVASIRLNSSGSGLVDDSVDPPPGDYAKAVLGLHAGDLQEVIGATANAYEQLAEILGESLPGDRDITDLLMEANRHLRGTNEEAETETSEAVEERDRMVKERASLQSQLGRYRELAARDPLTGVLNRGALVEATERILRNSLDRRTPIATFFLDIDDFKQLNDTYGHQRGDEILRQLADAILHVLPSTGVVGRYGGEEFVAVVPGLSESGAHGKGLELVASAQSVELTGLGIARPLTWSIGTTWGRPVQETSVNGLFAVADQLMYEAKRAGKNRCCFRSLESPVITDRTGTGQGDSLIGAIDSDPVSAPGPPLSMDEFCRIAAAISRSRPDNIVGTRK